jgi:hypothetical protein
MGRKRWTTRLTVEQCPIRLSAPDLRRLGVFRISWGSGELTWRYEDGGPTLACLSYEIKADANGARRIYFHPQILSTNPRWIVSAHSIRLLTTRPHFGGTRFWFRCDCGRRMGRLYLPMGSREFRCRICFNLTFRSAQTHDNRVSYLARHPDELSAALGDPRSRRWILAARAIQHLRDGKARR